MTRTKILGFGGVVVLLVGAGVWKYCSSIRNSDTGPGPHAAAISLDSIEHDDELVGTSPSSLKGRLGSPTYFSGNSRPTPQLTKPLDSLTDAELVSYLNSLQYDGSAHNSDLRKVTCARPSGICSPSSDSAVMFIQPDIGTRYIRREDITKNGLIVARVINYGGDTLGHDLRFGVPGQRRAWWAVDSSGGTLRSRMFIRTYDSAHPIHILEGDSAHTSYPYAQCTHPALPDTAPSNRPSKAKWSKCGGDSSYYSYAPPSRPASIFTLASYVRTVAFTPEVPRPSTAVELDGAWGTCDQWCCSTH